MKTVALFAITGFVSGFINGLFGTGGAIPILVFFTYLAFDTDRALATVNMAVMAVSLASFIFYLKNGTVTLDFLPDFMKKAFLPALLGGATGSLLLSRFSPDFLKKLFCLVTIVGGIGVTLK